jgi:hypothetical protein
MFTDYTENSEKPFFEVKPFKRSLIFLFGQGGRMAEDLEDVEDTWAEPDEARLELEDLARKAADPWRPLRATTMAKRNTRYSQWSRYHKKGFHKNENLVLPEFTVL